MGINTVAPCAIGILLLVLVVIALLFSLRRKGRKILSVIFVVLTVLTCWQGGLFDRPVKYAVQEEDFGEYKNYILVREVHYTGTGWVIAGDETGYFDNAKVRDIELLGEELPIAEMPEKYNTFLCIVEKAGTIEHEAFSEEIDRYLVKDWYPVYPVVRNRIWNDIFGSEKYMTQRDLKFY